MLAKVVYTNLRCTIYFETKQQCCK